MEISKVGESRKKNGGRKSGTPNKNTKILKDAILMAAELSGEDKNGKDGLVGYCKNLADNEPKAFASLLGRVLPTQMALTDDDGDLPSEILINIVTPKRELTDAELLQIAGKN